MVEGPALADQLGEEAVGGPLGQQRVDDVDAELDAEIFIAGEGLDRRGRAGDQGAGDAELEAGVGASFGRGGLEPEAGDDPGRAHARAIAKAKGDARARLAGDELDLRWQQLDARELCEALVDLLADELPGLVGHELVGEVVARRGADGGQRSADQAADEPARARADASGLVAQRAAEVDLAEGHELGVELALVEDRDGHDPADREGVDALDLELEADHVVAQLELGLVDLGVGAHVLVGAQGWEDLPLEDREDEATHERGRGGEGGPAGFGLVSVGGAEAPDEDRVDDALASVPAALDPDLDEVPAGRAREPDQRQLDLTAGPVAAALDQLAVDAQLDPVALVRGSQLAAPGQLLGRGGPGFGQGHDPRRLLDDHGEALLALGVGLERRAAAPQHDRCEAEAHEAWRDASEPHGAIEPQSTEMISNRVRRASRHKRWRLLDRSGFRGGHLGVVDEAGSWPLGPAHGRRRSEFGASPLHLGCKRLLVQHHQVGRLRVEGAFRTAILRTRTSCGLFCALLLVMGDPAPNHWALRPSRDCGGATGCNTTARQEGLPAVPDTSQPRRRGTPPACEARPVKPRGEGAARETQSVEFGAVSGAVRHRSRRTMRAALYPHIPWTPAPGWA
ncbi:hypothetical protein ENSA5_10640 [Enhygromyxa salina]|uniref:Uncharacterized protein n=1 Tax=Enhygromyxa salina TaxID=215803 RepID=A0A2S9YGC1_9BACT|nr:hypothetical protein ENSA5_10640 [Enhygromyxa salina]